MTDTSGGSASPPSFLNDLLDTFKTSVANVTGMAKFVGGAATNAAGSISGNIAGGDAGFNQQKGATAAEGGAATDVSNIQQDAAIKQKNDAAAIAQAGGVDPVASAAAAAQMRATRDQLLSVDQTISDNSKVSLFDDPLQWVGNKIQQPFLESQHDALSQQFTDQNKSLAAIEHTTSEAFALNTTLDQAASVSFKNAQAKLIAAKTQAEQGQLAVQEAQFNNQGITTALAATNEAFDINYKAMTAQGSLLSAVRETSIADLNEQYKNERIDMLAQKEEGQKQLQGYLNGITVVAGGPQYTVGQVQNMPRTQKAAIDNMIGPSQVGMAGFDPISAYKNVTNAAIPVLSGGDGIVRNYIGDHIATVEAQNPMFKSAPPELQQAAIMSPMKADIKKQTSDIPEVGGLYSPPPLATILKLPTVAQTDIGQRLDALANPEGKSNPDYPTRFSDVMAAAQQLIKEGKPITAVSQQVTQFARATIAATNGIKPYRKYALPELGTPEAGNGGYHVTVTSPGGGMVRQKSNIDMTNESQVGTYLRRISAAPVYNRAGLQSQNNPFLGGQ